MLDILPNIKQLVELAVVVIAPIIAFVRLTYTLKLATETLAKFESRLDKIEESICDIKINLGKIDVLMQNDAYKKTG